MTEKKQKAPQDAPRRNVQAANKRFEAVDCRLDALEAAMKELIEWKIAELKKRSSEVSE